MNELKLKSNVRIELSITGKYLDIDDISRILNMKPTRSFLKGEKYIKPTMKTSKERSFSLWVLMIGKEETYFSDNLVNKSLEIIESNQVGLKSIKEKFLCDIVLNVVLEIYETSPSFHLTPEQSRILADVGIDLDLDIYTY